LPSGGRQPPNGQGQPPNGQSKSPNGSDGEVDQQFHDRTTAERLRHPLLQILEGE
jgi:hypothetical protein